MAYQIRYPGRHRLIRRNQKSIQGQALWAAGLLCLFLLGGQLSKPFQETLDRVFCTAAVSSGYEAYARGDSIREILIRHCREKLIQAEIHG